MYNVILKLTHGQGHKVEVSVKTYLCEKNVHL